MGFWMTVLAVFVGVLISDILDAFIDAIRAKIRKNKKKESKIGFQDKKRDAYSPTVSGRRAIGFQIESKE